MKVLITGTDGYIGVMLAPYLQARGHEVVGLDTGFYRAGQLYETPTPSYPQLNMDIRDIRESDLAGFDAVVHLAELSNDPLGQHNPELTYTINHGGSTDLAHKRKQVGISRFVYTSSCSVYGIGGSDGVKTEQSTPNPQTVYAACKVLVERDLSAMASDDFTPTFLRNATAYGESPRMRFDIVVNNLAGLAWTTRQIRLTSDGSPWRPLVHVLDICEAVACVLDARRERVHNQILNVGATSENYQIRDIAEIISDTFTGCGLIFGNSDGDNRSYRVSFDKIREILPEFQCRWSVPLGVKQLYSRFAQINLTEEMFHDRAFTRLKQLEHLLASGQVNDLLCWTELAAA